MLKITVGQVILQQALYGVNVLLPLGNGRRAATSVNPSIEFTQRSLDAFVISNLLTLADQHLMKGYNDCSENCRKGITSWLREEQRLQFSRILAARRDLAHFVNAEFDFVPQCVVSIDFQGCIDTFVLAVIAAINIVESLF